MSRRIATAGCGLCLAFVAGCGSSDEEFDPIPARSAEAILKQLDQVAERCDAGRTNSALFQVRELQDKADALPEGIDPALREAVRDGVDRLGQLVQADCSQDEPVETDTQPTETDPEETVPTESTETQTETETQPEPTTPPPTTPPPTTEPPPAVEPSPGQGGGTPGPGADSGIADGARR